VKYDQPVLLKCVSSSSYPPSSVYENKSIRVGYFRCLNKKMFSTEGQCWFRNIHGTKLKRFINQASSDTANENEGISKRV
jgi:hypothetical protein